MKKVKALLYCTKAKPYLVKDEFPYKNEKPYFIHYKKPGRWGLPLNGTIVAQCYIEVEELFIKNIGWASTSGMTEEMILYKSRLQKNQLNEYLGNNGYALHISNLRRIKDEEHQQLSYYKIDNTKTYGSFGWAFEESKKYIPLQKAPQNMMRVYDPWDADENGAGELCVLISIRPEWLCKILNGEKTIEVRKRVLKGMIDNSI